MQCHHYSLYKDLLINCNIKCRAKFGKSIAYWNKFYVYTAISMADL